MAKKKVVRNARKKVATTRKKVLKKVGSATKKVAKKAGGAVKKIANAGGTAALLPFVAMMNKAIKNKGETPEKDLIKKAKQFQKLIMNRNFQDKDGLGFDSSEYFEENNLIEDVTSLVKDIVSFIKKLDAKKKSGEATPEELEELEAAEKGIEKAVNDERGASIGDTVAGIASNPINLLFIGLLLAAALYAFKKG